MVSTSVWLGKKEWQQHGQKLIAQEIHNTYTSIVVIIEKKAEKERELGEELYTISLQSLHIRWTRPTPFIIIGDAAAVAAGDSDSWSLIKFNGIQWAALFFIC